MNTFSGTVTLNAGTLEFNSVADSGTASAWVRGPSSTLAMRRRR
ncbi:hypothetical protein [Verrucomicrobium spinosum]|nr:hypothetical protein [Verrucomicrobium spinosum]